MKKPVLFLIFNRPETTFRVFEAIRAYQPTDLYIGADGPRAGNESDAVRCAEVRKVVEKVDWPCQVHTLFREKNLGCRYAPSGAISWFFEQEEEGIILEDDCLPSLDFFRFCEEMLDRYREDTRIMHIGGVNFQDGQIRGNGSYYFSQIPHIWGWASWRRAWQNYDVEMSDFPAFVRDRKYTSVLSSYPYYQWYFVTVFKHSWKQSPWINTWDYQWHYTVLKMNGLTVVPNCNLVSNIGGAGTHDVSEDLCNIQLQTLPETIREPAVKDFDYEADLYTYRKTYSGGKYDRFKFIIFSFCKMLKLDVKFFRIPSCHK